MKALLAVPALALLLASVAVAQPKPADPPRASALKTPDGAIVFIARNPDDADPAVEKVVLSAAEWKALQDQVEQAKKLATAKSVAPSSCAVRVRIEMRGEKPVARVTVTFGVRTVAPRTVVALGLQRAQVTAARGEANRLPVLNASADDGLTVLFEAAGEHVLTLEAEAAVGPRGKGELGFDLGLPRAAITTLVVELPPATAAKKLTVGTRTDGKATEPKRAAVGADQLARPVPLGATDTLELTWEPPTAAAPAAATCEADVVVRVEDSQIETTAKLRLRGPLKEWQLALPPGADVTVASETAAAPPTVVRPTDANRAVWTIRGPADPTADWLVTVLARQTRPKLADPKFRGPYPLGPFSPLGPVKASGKLAFLAPPAARLSFRAPPDFRRQDVPDDGTVAAFQFNTLPPVPPNGKPPAWLDLDARQVPVAARVKVAHALALRADGWHWDATVKVTPPPRGEVEQLLLDLPAGWETLTAKPEDLVDEVQAISDGGPVRSRLIRFGTPQKAAFEIALSSRFPLPVAVGVAGKVLLPLPRFPQADERDGTVSATVPEEFELRGLIGTEPLKPPAGRRPPVVSASGDMDRGADRVELSWQPHRPDQSCDARAEITVLDQQIVVTQVLKFRTPGDGKPIRLRGPVVGLKAVPAVDPVAPGEWEVRPPADGEFTLTLGFALRHPPRKPGATNGEFAVGLFAPVQFARHDTVARVWLASNGRRLDSFSGPGWRELPPEPDAVRDILPSFTLAAVGAPPLAVQWANDTDTGPAVVADRGLILATIRDDGTAAVRGRFVLRRWPAGGVELELPAAAEASYFIDGKRIAPQPGPPNDDADERTVRLALPELKPNRQTALLDVRYTVATANGGGARVLIPPMPRSAAYRAPVRWHVTAPGGTVPLFPGATWQAENRWGWRGFGFAPTAATAPADLEQWLTAGADTEPVEGDSWAAAAGGETLAARQPQPERVTVVLLPRVGWVAGVSAAAFVLGLLVSRLRARWCGPAVAAVGVALAVGAAVAPQPAAQAVAAAQPGIALLALVLASAFGWRWYARRRIDRLPAFSRSRGSAPALGLPTATAVPPVPSGASRSNRGQSAEVNLEPDLGSAR